MAIKMSTYDKGDLVRLSGSFTDENGVAQDPSVVVCQYKDPSGNTTTYTYGEDDELVRDSAGNYHVDVDADEIGVWSYRFYSTGSGQAAAEQQFSVKRSEF